jgi:hypothetical protein
MNPTWVVTSVPLIGLDKPLQRHIVQKVLQRRSSRAVCTCFVAEPVVIGMLAVQAAPVPTTAMGAHGGQAHTHKSLS